jgi:hypothetical protein
MKLLIFPSVHQRGVLILKPSASRELRNAFQIQEIKLRVQVMHLSGHQHHLAGQVTHHVELVFLFLESLFMRALHWDDLNPHSIPLG